METEPYLRSPQVLTSPGPEFADELRRFQGIPGLERAPSGRLWATWYGGGVSEDNRNYVLLATSTDEGESWSGVKTVIDPDGDGPVRAYDPCLWHDPQGRLWWFWAQGYEGHTDERAGVWAMVTDDSDAEDPVWSAPRRLGDGIMMNKPIAVTSGEWLLPAARWKVEGSGGVLGSQDRGATWEPIGAATVSEEEDRNCDEHMLVERRDGSLWMLVRTNYGIGESVSVDGGRQWAPVTPSALQHPTTRFFIWRLGTGNLLLVKHGPLETRTDRSQLTAYVSRDDGATWGGGLLLDERAGVSYPDGVQAPDGTIYLIYDYDRRGAKEILLARFSEGDVAQGRCESNGSALRLLVNKASGELVQ